MSKFKINTLSIILSLSLMVFVGCLSETTDAGVSDNDSSEESSAEESSSSEKNTDESSSSVVESSSEKESSSSEAVESSVVESSTEEDADVAAAQEALKEAEEALEKLIEDDEDCESDECQEAEEAIEQAEADLKEAEEATNGSDSSIEEISSSEETESSSEAVEESSSEPEEVLVGAVVPASETESWASIMMGDVKLLLNKWGSDALAEEGSCGSTYEIWAKEDHSFGWTFDRPDCGGGGMKPDYPEVEIGVAPFTSEEKGHTTSTLLPLQIKDIMSASIIVDNFKIELGASSSWNINFEMWLSQEDPTTTLTPKPEIELMTFWGWYEGRWGCEGSKYDGSKNLSAGTLDYTLCHYGEEWGGDDHSKWDYYQFRAGDGQDYNSKKDFTGTLDVKAALDWLVNNTGASKDLWVTRFELGTEIDNNTSGTVSFDNVTFEVNGEKRSPEFAN